MPALIYRCETCNCVVCDMKIFTCPDCGLHFCSKHKQDVKTCQHKEVKE